MKKSYTKSPSVCNFTIHAVKLGAHDTNPFQVKWKRGETKGMTERAFAGDDDLVTFEKKFQCPCVIYIEKRTRQAKPKYLSVSVMVLKGEKKMIFGKVTVDISKYYKVELPELCELELESPHSKKSMITISFSTTPSMAATTIAAGIMTEMSLMSVSDAMNFKMEKREDWDVSETVSPEDKERIEKFFIKREEDNEARRLAQFKRIGKAPSKPTLRFAPPVVPERAEASAPKSEELASFLGKGASPRKRPGKRDTARERKAFRASLPCLTEQPEILESTTGSDAAPAEVVHVSATNLLKSVLGKHWCKSPVQASACPTAVAAVIASFLYANMLDEVNVEFEAFEDMMKEWTTNFENEQLVENETPRDKVIVIMFIMRCLSSMSEGDAKRKAYFQDQVKQLLNSALDAYVSDFISKFGTLADAIINHKITGDQAGDKINKEIATILQSQNLPKPLAEVVKTELIKKIDAFLVNFLCNSDSQCTFGSAGQWNTLITIMDGDKDIHLKLFRQAVGVLMFGQPLCGDPGLAKELCADLPPDVVLHLLNSEKPDDAMPVPNDTRAFQSHYKLDPDSGFGAVNASIDSNLDAVIAALPGDWKSCRFDSDSMQKFPFLRKFFSK